MLAAYCLSLLILGWSVYCADCAFTVTNAVVMTVTFTSVGLVSRTDVSDWATADLVALLKYKQPSLSI